MSACALYNVDPKNEIKKKKKSKIKIKNEFQLKEALLNFFSNEANHQFKSESNNMFLERPRALSNTSSPEKPKLNMTSLKPDERNLKPDGRFRSMSVVPACNLHGMNRCLLTSIQIRVAQVFKAMDTDFDQKLSYFEFKKGVHGLLVNANNSEGKNLSFQALYFSLITIGKLSATSIKKMFSLLAARFLGNKIKQIKFI